MKNPSKWEKLFLERWNSVYPKIIWTPHVKLFPMREFEWDFYHPSSGVAIEIQGAIHVKGGHSTGTGINRDCEKLFLCAEMGIVQFNFTPEMIKDKEENYLHRLYLFIKFRMERIEINRAIGKSH